MILALCMLCRFGAGQAAFTLPEALTEIGDEAFAGCAGLNSAEVPESVTSIGEDAFSGCGEALLILTEPGSEAVNYARTHQLDYRAGTQYRALLIGQMYHDSVITPLDGPVNDITALQTRLPQIGWTVTTRSDLTAEGIRAAIGTALGGATENDVSLFYYSGHGYEDGSLVGTDAEGLTPESLRNALDGIPGRKVVIVDACYSGQLITEDGGQAKGAQTRKAAKASGPADGSEAFINSFQAAFRPRLRGALNTNSYYVITAARADEECGEEYITAGGSGRYMGVFTYYLCLGIGYNGVVRQTAPLNADINGDGAVSIQEAYGYAAANATERNPYQHAVVWPAGCRWFAPFRQ